MLTSIIHVLLPPSFVLYQVSSNAYDIQMTRMFILPAVLHVEAANHYSSVCSRCVVDLDYKCGLYKCSSVILQIRLGSCSLYFFENCLCMPSCLILCIFLPFLLYILWHPGTLCHLVIPTFLIAQAHLTVSHSCRNITGNYFSLPVLFSLYDPGALFLNL